MSQRSGFDDGFESPVKHPRAIEWHELLVASSGDAGGLHRFSIHLVPVSTGFADAVAKESVNRVMAGPCAGKAGLGHLSHGRR